MCSGPETVTSCLDGFYLKTGDDDVKRCLPCSTENALECDDKDEATECKIGYFLNTDKKCEACSKNTRTCTSATVSKSCNAGFGVKDDNCETACGDNIFGCDGTKPDEAIACNTGYVLKDDKTCAECNNKDKVTKCKKDDQSKAEECIIGYSVISDECKKCPDNAAECTVKETEATKCLDGYLLDSNACAAKCSEGGLTCSAADSHVSCIEGYAFIGKTSKVCQKCTANGAS